MLRYKKLQNYKFFINIAIFGLKGQSLKSLEGDWNDVPADLSLESKKLIAFYFSAHWGPPCRNFAPILKAAYDEYSEESNDIEIVFVSSERSLEDMKEYMKTSLGSWLALPYNSKPCASLKSRFNIQGIPAVIVCKNDGQVITEDGKGEIQRAGPEGMRQWLTKI